MTDQAESFLSPSTLDSTLDDLVLRREMPAWLAAAVRLMAAEIELIPFDEDAERYIVDFVYPH